MKNICNLGTEKCCIVSGSQAVVQCQSFIISNSKMLHITMREGRDTHNILVNGDPFTFPFLPTPQLETQASVTGYKEDKDLVEDM